MNPKRIVGVARFELENGTTSGNISHRSPQPERVATQLLSRMPVASRKIFHRNVDTFTTRVVI